MKPIILIAVVCLTGCGIPIGMKSPQSSGIPGELVVTKVVERVEVPVVKEVTVEKIVEKIVEVPAKRVPTPDGGKGFVDPTPKIANYDDAVKAFDGMCADGSCTDIAKSASGVAKNTSKLQSPPQRRGLFRRRGG